MPTYVRVVDGFPMTETNKVIKRELVRRAVGGRLADVVAPRPRWPLVPFTDDDAAALRKQFDATGRAHVLDV